MRIFEIIEPADGAEPGEQPTGEVGAFEVVAVAGDEPVFEEAEMDWLLGLLRQAGALSDEPPPVPRLDERLAKLRGLAEAILEESEVAGLRLRPRGLADLLRALRDVVAYDLTDADVDHVVDFARAQAASLEASPEGGKVEAYRLEPGWHVSPAACDTLARALRDVTEWGPGLPASPPEVEDPGDTLNRFLLLHEEARERGGYRVSE